MGWTRSGTTTFITPFTHCKPAKRLATTATLEALSDLQNGHPEWLCLFRAVFRIPTKAPGSASHGHRAPHSLSCFLKITTRWETADWEKGAAA